MKVRCKKTLSQIVRGISINFNSGEEYTVYSEVDGRDYIVNSNYKFYFHHYDPNFLKCFDILDDFTEEDMKEILQFMSNSVKKEDNNE